MHSALKFSISGALCRSTSNDVNTYDVTNDVAQSRDHCVCVALHVTVADDYRHKVVRYFAIGVFMCVCVCGCLHAVRTVLTGL